MRGLKLLLVWLQLAVLVRHAIPYGEFFNLLLQLMPEGTR